MRQGGSSGYYENGEEEGRSSRGNLPPEPDITDNEDASVLDSEVVLRKTFETNPSAGIELLFRWYYRPLCSHAVRYVSSREVAEDIVSDVFYTFHSQQLFLKIGSSYRAYLFTSVRHKAFDYVRNEMKRSTSLQYAEYVSIRKEQQPDSIVQFEDMYHDVTRAINMLPVKRRQIYIMHRFEGKKYQEIAEEMNLSVRTVDTHMYQAIHEIRKLLNDRWWLWLLPGLFSG